MVVLGGGGLFHMSEVPLNPPVRECLAHTGAHKINNAVGQVRFPPLPLPQD